LYNILEDTKTEHNNGQIKYFAKFNNSTLRSSATTDNLCDTFISVAGPK